jgi:peptide/nickel transport system substrate-binding protein|tara:strand:+ start:560 stop:2158 length:1599 start_codon:yes stop_codon:yes gene_type:complete
LQQPFLQKKDKESLIIGATILPSTFDPDNFSKVNPWKNPMNWDMQVQLFDTLFEYDTQIINNTKVQDTSKILPVLAESISSSQDGYIHQIKLKQNIYSEYGNELTADDIAWSWQATKASPDKPQPPNIHWLDTKDPGEVGRWIALTGSAPVETNPLSIVDKYTVEFTLREPSIAFPHILTMMLPPIYDSVEAKKHANSKDLYARNWLAGHSCGFSVYGVDEISKEFIVLKSRNSYSRINPQIKKIKYQLINADDRINLIKKGDIDLITSLSPEEAESLSSINSIKVFEASGNQQLSMQMDTRIYPFNNLSFRKALMHLTPYRTILDKIYLGHARAWKGVVSDISPAYEHLFSGKTSSLQAKQELLKSTYRGETIKLSYIKQNELQKNIVNSICLQAKKINLLIDPDPIDAGQMSSMQKKFQIPFAIAGGGHRCAEMSYAMPHDFGDQTYGITNWINYNNKKLNILIEKIKYCRNEIERLGLIKESHSIVANDLPWIFIAQPNYMIAFQNNLKNISWRSRASGPQSYAQLYWQ